MSENIIVDKSFGFAIEIVSLYNHLIKDKKEYVLSKQLLRSGTSIGANVREGINGVSRADFKNKLAIALKEAKESEYWIELMIATDILKEDEAKPIKNDCIELCRILSKIIKTCNGN
ncbi:four helix bundle protein [Clostridium amylolyticum]|uniref:Four helix bundle protein n=1 Tax=Clostridium amylolyticum TaxID=1121298 RepID=A0A1M6JFV1_9CLOT|nr:four helix bundle protein [Clostridium amylolyticum]SHJ45545.1 four helix bundle protein [Clostridium amylolyticum]